MNKDNCRFCELIETKKCYVIYEDDLLFAFLDKNPVNSGHVLVIPKKHVSDFENIDDNTYSKIMFFSKELSLILKEITNCLKVGVLIAGFDISHAHVHVIPMHSKKDVCTKRVFDPDFCVEEERFDEISEEIKRKLSSLPSNCL